MNLATPIRIRATFEAYRWPNTCTVCGADEESLSSVDPDGYPYTLGRVRCTECDTLAVPDPANDPIERRGWVNPSNPWGSFEQMTDDDSADPDSVELPFGEALEFLADFPGGIWDYCEGESEENYRTGESKAVTAHVDGPGDSVELLFLALNATAIR